MNAPHRLQGFPPISPETIGKALRDGRAYRGDAVFVRLSGPAVHKRIGFNPPVDWLGLVCKAVIIAGAGAVVALWVGVL